MPMPGGLARALRRLRLIAVSSEVQSTSVTTHRLILAGLGNVGRRFLEILLSHSPWLRDRYGVA
jgi:hypothetical protein